VIGLFWVYAGVDPPTAITLRRKASAGPTDAKSVEAEIFALINADRKRHGLYPLKRHTGADAIARAHSYDMLRSGFVGHVSPTTGKPSDRVRGAGLPSPVVLENVAKSYSARDAEEGLMASPAHRASILNAAVTHVGVGVVVYSAPDEAPSYLVTQLFLRLAPPADPARAAAAILRRINEWRREKGLRRLDKDRELATLARRACEKRLRRGASPEAVASELDRDLDALGGRFELVATLFSVVAAPELIPRSSEFIDRRFDAAGVGAAAGDRSAEGTDGLCVIVLLGKRR
jgi:uncharacterized protein YkwD